MGDVISFDPREPKGPPDDDLRAAIDPLLDEIARVYSIDRTILAGVGDEAVACGKQMLEGIRCNISLRTFPPMTSDQREEISQTLEAVSDERALHCFSVLIERLPELVLAIWGAPQLRA